MQKNEKKSLTQKIKKFLMAFVHAGEGIISGFGERNMRVHGLATVAVLLLASWVKLNREEWFIVLILIASVWSAELANTAIEELANTLRDELKLRYDATTRARDTAAGAVLIIAMIAAFIGLWIFVPKIWLKLV